MSQQKLDWIPVTEQPDLPESGFYLLTLEDTMFPEDASWNEVHKIYYDLKEKSFGWDRYKNRIIAWAKITPYHAPAQRI